MASDYGLKQNCLLFTRFQSLFLSVDWHFQAEIDKSFLYCMEYFNYK
ncbi:hypothetical protein HMPREF0496_0938 [Lentilactobacillus hilgardii ATCC 27305]|nr:hypothetical protein HMPREF0496_0938 [Lentilactobacillus hilgardii ATCC 27305]